jgi:hypothetical protein
MNRMLRARIRSTTTPHWPAPASPALVWGWAAELYVAQDWQSTMPYVNVLGLSMSPANREVGKPMVRAGIERAGCVIDATSIKRARRWSTRNLSR